MTLPPGALLALYTDGLVERRDRATSTSGSTSSPRALDAADGPIGGPPGRARRPRWRPRAADDDVAVLVACVPEDAARPSAALSIADDVRAVHQARAFTARRWSDWALPGSLARDAVLLVSEMVTNAIVHGRAPIELRLRRAREHLLLEVDDTATAVPRKLRPTADDDHGRGLQLVAMMADEWGTRPIRDGKSVWCALDLTRYF